jgi:hypothetical protein
MPPCGQLPPHWGAHFRFGAAERVVPGLLPFKRCV